MDRSLYNPYRRRRHLLLGYLSQISYEHLYYAAQSAA